jgi:hypothetical protein
VTHARISVSVLGFEVAYHLRRGAAIVSEPEVGVDAYLSMERVHACDLPREGWLRLLALTERYAAGTRQQGCEKKRCLDRA